MTSFGTDLRDIQPDSINYVGASDGNYALGGGIPFTNVSVHGEVNPEEGRIVQGVGYSHTAFGGAVSVEARAQVEVNLTNEQMILDASDNIWDSP